MPPQNPFENKVETPEDRARNLARGQAIIAEAKARAEKEQQVIAEATSNTMPDTPENGKITTELARVMSTQNHENALTKRLRKAAQAD